MPDKLAPSSVVEEFNYYLNIQLSPPPKTKTRVGGKRKIQTATTAHKRTKDACPVGDFVINPEQNQTRDEGTWNIDKSTNVPKGAEAQETVPTDSEQLAINPEENQIGNLTQLNPQLDDCPVGDFAIESADAISELQQKNSETREEGTWNIEKPTNVPEGAPTIMPIHSEVEVQIIPNIRTELDDLEKTILYKTKQLEKSKNQAQDLLLEKAALDVRIESDAEEIEQLKSKQLEKYKNMAQDLLLEKSALGVRIETDAEEIEQLKSDKATLEKRNSDQSKEFAQISTEKAILERCKLDLSEEIDHMKAEKAILEKHKLNLSHKVDFLEREKVDSDMKIGEFSKEMDLLKADKLALEDNRLEFELKMEQLKFENAELIRVNRELCVKVMEFKTKYEELEAKHKNSRIKDGCVSEEDIDDE